MSKAKGWMSYLAEVRTLIERELSDQDVKEAMKGYIGGRTVERTVEIMEN